MPKILPRAMEAEDESLTDPTWAENNINPVTPVIALASDMNTWAHQVSHSIRYLRETAPLVYDLSANLSGFNPKHSVLFGQGLRWQVGVGLNKPTLGDIFYVNGKRLDLFTQQILNIAGIANHTFPPSTRVWVYASGAYLDRVAQVGGQGTTQPAAPPLSVDLYFHNVGAGNPPVVPPGYFIVSGVNTNAVGITSIISFTAFPFPYTLTDGLVLDVPSVLINGEMELNGGLVVQGSGNFFDEVNIFSSLNVFDNAHFLGDVTIDGNTIINDDLTVDNLTVNIGATINAMEVNLDITNFGTFSVDGESTFFGPVVMNNTLEVNGTTEFNANVSTNAQLSTGGLLEVGGDLSMQSVAFMDQTFLQGTVSLTDIMTVSGALGRIVMATTGRFIITPKTAPGAPIDGELWITSGPGSALFFRDDPSVTQKVWATPSGYFAGQTVQVGTFNVTQPAGLVTVISRDVSLALGTSGLVTMTADLRFDGGAAHNILVQAFADAVLVYSVRYRMLVSANNEIQHRFVFSRLIAGSVTTMSLRADIEGVNVVDSTDILNAVITVTGGGPLTL